MADFIIDSISIEKEYFVVVGAVNEGTIYLNATFGLFVAGWPGTPDFDASPRLAVRLLVVQIITYRKFITELNQGMTGALHLTGDGGCLLRPRGTLVAEK